MPAEFRFEGFGRGLSSWFRHSCQELAGIHLGVVKNSRMVKWCKGGIFVGMLQEVFEELMGKIVLCRFGGFPAHKFRA